MRDTHHNPLHPVRSTRGDMCRVMALVSELNNPECMVDPADLPRQHIAPLVLEETVGIRPGHGSDGVPFSAADDNEVREALAIAALAGPAPQMPEDGTVVQLEDWRNSHTRG